MRHWLRNSDTHRRAGCPGLEGWRELPGTFSAKVFRAGGFMLLGLVVVGCAKTPRPVVNVWAADDRFGAPLPASSSEHVDVYDADTHTVRLHGALNEVVSFKLGVAAAGSVDARVDDFVSSGGRVISGNVSLYRMHSVEVSRWPGWHIKRVDPRRRAVSAADVLVPVTAPAGGLPVTLRSEETVELWVDVRIPKGTSPGRYTSTIQVYVDEQPAGKLDIALDVWPVVLPDVAGPEMVIDLDHQALFFHHVVREGVRHSPARIFAGSPLRDELEGTLASAMRLLHEHRLSPQLSKLYPIAKVDAAQHLTVDWSDYDRVVSGYINGSAYSDRLPARSWSIPFDESFPEPPAYGAMSSPLYSHLAREYLGGAAEHFDARGWLARSYVKVPGADRMSPEACEATRHFGYIIRHADPRLRVLSHLFPQDATRCGWYGFRHEELRDYVDIWAPPGSFFDRRAIESDYRSVAWLTADRPPYSGSIAVQAPAVDARVLAWQGKAAGASAVYLGTANDWPSGDDDGPQACIEHDPHVLIYPGRPFGLREPIPSVRLKRLRRGLQDVALLELLESRGQGHIAATILDSLVIHFGTDAYGAHLLDGRPRAWIEDPRWWDLARRIIGDELRAALDSVPRRRSTSVPTTIRWRRFMNATRKVYFEPGGVRIRPVSTHPDDGVEVECTVTIANRKRTPLAGTLRFEDLPIGWRGASPLRRVPRLAPGESRSVVLTARAASLTWNEDGVRYLPLIFEGEDGFCKRFSVRMCHLTAQQLESPIILDGDLGDWPTGVGNYASDFLLISGETNEETGLGASAPTHTTLCFVGLYGGRLYCALRCPFSGGRNGGKSSGSAVTLEDLVPVGEDAAEILIDPTNSGTRSPADVYRIVVRRGGVNSEYGVTMDPRTGPRRHWAATVRHAFRLFDGHWTAEVEIPLDAFPEACRKGAVWGFNVTRFDDRCQEYANWAGAVGNVYSPRSLGNMTIP